MNVFEATNHYIRKASPIMNLGPRVEQLLLSLEAEHHVTIPSSEITASWPSSADTASSTTPREDPLKVVSAFIRR
jgi:hypothetical protein